MRYPLFITVVGLVAAAGAWAAEPTLRLTIAPRQSHAQFATIGDPDDTDLLSIAYAIAYTRDGKTLLSGIGGGAIRYWDVATRRNIRTVTGHTGAVRSLALSHDGRTVASGGMDKTIRLWDVAANVNTRTLRGHDDDVCSLTFTPNDRELISYGLDRTVRFWNVRSGENTRTYKSDEKARLSAMALSPDGQTLAAGDERGTICLRKTASGRITATLKNPERVDVLSFSPDGRTLAVGGLGTLRAWNLESRQMSRLARASAGIVSVAFRPDGRAIACGLYPCCTLLYDLDRKERSVLSMDGSAWGVAFSPDGASLAATEGAAVKIWDPRTVSHTNPQGHTGVVTCLAFNPDGTVLASGSDDNEVKLWSPVDGRHIGTLSGHSGRVDESEFTRDGAYFVTRSADGTIRMWDVAARKNTATYSAVAYLLRLTPDGKTVIVGEYTAATGCTLRCVDRATGKTTATRTTEPWLLDVSRDGEKSLSQSKKRGLLEMRDIATGKLLLSIPQPPNAIARARFSPDNAVVGVGFEDTIEVWSVRNCKRTAILAGGGRDCLAFSTDGKVLASAVYDSEFKFCRIEVWDVASGKKTVIPRPHAGAILALAFSPDGKILASGGMDWTIKLWDLNRK